MTRRLGSKTSLGLTVEDLHWVRNLNQSKCRLIPETTSRDGHLWSLSSPIAEHLVGDEYTPARVGLSIMGSH
jgi:hypothetical protein